MTKKYPIEDAAEQTLKTVARFFKEIVIELRDWRRFMMKIPRRKNERIWWFLISTTWLASWTTLIAVIFGRR